MRILQRIFTNQFTIKDSFSFADWAKTYDNNEMMCLFDVIVYKRSTWWDNTNLSWLIVSPSRATNIAPLSLESSAGVRYKEEPFHIWWPILWPNWWHGYVLSFRVLFWPISLCAILKKNGFLITTLALRFGFNTSTIPSPCSTVKTQQLSFYTT